MMTEKTTTSMRIMVNLFLSQFFALSKQGNNSFSRIQVKSEDEESVNSNEEKKKIDHSRRCWLVLAET